MLGICSSRISGWCRGSRTPAFQFNAVNEGTALLAQRLDIADQVVDLGARQREVRHRSVRVRQESAQLVGSHATAGNHLEAWRALWDGTGRITANNVAIGAPLPRDLHALAGIGMGGGRCEAGNHRQAD